MPNTLKYSTTGDTFSLRKGNYYIGVGDVTKGPTSTTGHWNGITPPVGGYTIYENKSANGPSIRVPADSTTLIDYSNRLYSGTSITTTSGAITYLNGVSTIVCVNADYESIITSGLTFLVDAGYIPSYYTTGTNWLDVSTNNINGTLNTGVTYNSANQGSLIFNGTTGLVNFGNQNLSLDLTNKTFCAWIKLGTISNVPTSIIDKQFDSTPPSNNYGGWGFWVQSNRKLWWWNMPNQDILDTGSSTIGTDVWTHVAVTYNYSSKTASFYINGSLNSSISNSNISEQSSGSQSLVVGATRFNQPNVGGYLNGSIANVMAYNRVLSSSEILQNYNAQLSRFQASFDPDAQAFITAAGITNPTQQTAINDLVVGLKADSLWTQITAIYPFVGGTASSHKYNLKDPRDLDVAYRLTFYGGWVHDNNGILGNGTNTYADTYYVNNAISTIGAYTYGRNLSFSYNEEFESCDDEGCYTVLGARLSFGQIYASPYVEVPGNYTQGHIQTGLGSGGVNQTGYRNGRSIGTNTLSSGPIYPKGKLAIGAIRYVLTDGGSGVISDYILSYGNTLQSFAYFSSNALDSTQTQNLYNRIQTFQSSLGRLITTLNPSDSDVFAFTSNLDMISSSDSSVVNTLNTFVASLKTQNLWSKITYLNPILTNLRNILPYSSGYNSISSYPVGGWGITQSTVSYSTILTPSYSSVNTSLAVFSGNGVSGDHLLTSYAVPTTNGSGYTLSTYVKANTNNFIQLVVSGTSNLWANFNVSAGTVGTVGSAATASIQDAGNGWYRCIISGTITNTSTNVLLRLVTSATSSLGENNTLNTSVYLWISQFELGSTATYPQIMTTYNLAVQNQFSNAIKYPTGTGNLLIQNTWTSTPKGMLANGTNNYAQITSPTSSYMTTSNGHIAIYSRNNITITDKYLFGVNAVNQAYLRVAIGSPLLIQAQMGNNNFFNYIEATPSNTLGLFISSYSGSTFKLYQNGNSIASTSSYPTPLSLPQQGQVFGAYNNQNTPQNFSTVDISLISMGQGFTDAEASSYNTINNTYQTALSRNV